MYWQYYSAAARSGKWKGDREGRSYVPVRPEQGQGGENDLSAKHPEIAAKFKRYITEGYREPRSQKDDGKYTGKSKK